MNNFDPFRFSQHFEPEPTDCKLPPVGLLPYEDTPAPPKSNRWTGLLIFLPFVLLLLASIWSQGKRGHPQIPHRSVFE